MFTGPFVFKILLNRWRPGLRAGPCFAVYGRLQGQAESELEKEKGGKEREIAKMGVRERFTSWRGQTPPVSTHRIRCSKTIADTTNMTDTNDKEVKQKNPGAVQTKF